MSRWMFAEPARTAQMKEEEWRRVAAERKIACGRDLLSVFEKGPGLEEQMRSAHRLTFSINPSGSDSFPWLFLAAVWVKAGHGKPISNSEGTRMIGLTRLNHLAFMLNP